MLWISLQLQVRAVEQNYATACIIFPTGNLQKGDDKCKKLAPCFALLKFKTESFLYGDLLLLTS